MTKEILVKSSNRKFEILSDPNEGRIVKIYDGRREEPTVFIVNKITTEKHASDDVTIFKFDCKTGGEIEDERVISVYTVFNDGSRSIHFSKEFYKIENGKEVSGPHIDMVYESGYSITDDDSIDNSVYKSILKSMTDLASGEKVESKVFVV